MHLICIYFRMKIKNVRNTLKTASVKQICNLGKRNKWEMKIMHFTLIMKHFLTIRDTVAVKIRGYPMNVTSECQNEIIAY